MYLRSFLHLCFTLASLASGKSSHLLSHVNHRADVDFMVVAAPVLNQPSEAAITPAPARLLQREYHDITVTEVVTSTVTSTTNIPATQTSAVTVTKTATVSSTVTSQTPEKSSISAHVASVNAARASATLAADKFLYIGQQSVATVDHGEYKSFRRRLAEVTQVLFKINKNYLPRIIFSDSDYTASDGDGKPISSESVWTEMMNKNDRNVLSVYESTDKEQLFADLVLWPSGQESLLINTTWKAKDERYTKRPQYNTRQMYLE